MRLSSESHREGRESVKRLIALLAVLLVAAGATAGTAGAAPWTYVGTNVVASSPTAGGGYPVPPGSRVPEAGACRAGPVKPHPPGAGVPGQPNTQDLVGSAQVLLCQESTVFQLLLAAGPVPVGETSGA